MRLPLTELEQIERDTPAWTTDAQGVAVRREDYLDYLIEDAARPEVDGRKSELIKALKGTGRKSMSIPKIIELIEEMFE
jgi:hypothetical protein